MLKPLFEENSSSPSECEQQPNSNNNNNMAAAAFFTAPPPPPPPQQQPAPPFPSHVSPYVIPMESTTTTDDERLCPPDLSRHQIGLLEKLGETGSFGPSHHSTALHFAELVDTSSSSSFAGRKCVFLRLIQRRTTTTTNDGDFISQVKRLSVLRDPSIAKVVAMATNLSSSDDVIMLGLMTEYLEGGPLPIYLRQYRLGAADNFDPGVKTIR